MDSHIVRGSLALLQNLMNRQRFTKEILKVCSRYNIGDEVSWEQGGKESRGVVEYIQVRLEANKYDSRTSVSYTIRGEDDVLYALHEDYLK